VEALNRCRSLEPGSKQAIAACEKALSLHADYIDAHYFLGVNHIYAGDEAAAKQQLAALIKLDPTMAGMLANSMDVLTNWLTEEYRQELQSMFPAATATDEPNGQITNAYAEFSDQEVARILEAYEKQIAVLQNLMANPNSRPKACELQAPMEFRNQLKEELTPLSFVRIEASPNPDCLGLRYLLLDVRDPGVRQRGRSEVVKIAKNLELGDAERERWRVGLYQEWVAEKYCKEECTARLEFRIDREIDGQTVKLKAWLGGVEEIADTVQCVSSYHGELPRAEEW
jgi:hypothetical protein